MTPEEKILLAELYTAKQELQRYKAAEARQRRRDWYLDHLWLPIAVSMYLGMWIVGNRRHDVHGTMLIVTDALLWACLIFAAVTLAVIFGPWLWRRWRTRQRAG